MAKGIIFSDLESEESNEAGEPLVDLDRIAFPLGLKGEFLCAILVEADLEADGVAN